MKCKLKKIKYISLNKILVIFISKIKNNTQLSFNIYKHKTFFFYKNKQRKNK